MKEDRYAIIYSAWQFLNELVDSQSESSEYGSLHLAGVCGTWGSGKTSFVNMMAALLREDDELVKEGKVDKGRIFKEAHKDELAQLREKVQMLHFSCLEVIQENGIVPALFKKLSLDKGTPFGEGSSLITILPEVYGISPGKLWAHRQNRLAEQNRQQLKERLEWEKKTYIVVIDDIERLSPEESLKVLKELSQVYAFPYVVYLFPYDESRLAQNVGLACGLRDKHECIEYGRHYLEKLIPYRFLLPTCALEDEILRRIEDLLKRQAKEDQDEIQKDFDNPRETQIVVESLKNPRDITLFFGAIEHDFGDRLAEIYLFDLLLLRILQKRWPEVYVYIKDCPFDFLRSREEVTVDDVLAQMRRWFALTQEKRHERLASCFTNRKVPKEEFGLIEEVIKLLFHPDVDSSVLYACKSIGSPLHFSLYFDLEFKEPEAWRDLDYQKMREQMASEEKCLAFIEGYLKHPSPQATKLLQGGMISRYFSAQNAVNGLMALAQFPQYLAKAHFSDGWSSCYTRVDKSFEQGEISADQFFEIFQKLIRSGTTLYMLQSLLHDLEESLWEMKNHQKFQILNQEYLARLKTLCPRINSLEDFHNMFQRGENFCVGRLQNCHGEEGKVLFWEIIQGWLSDLKNDFSVCCALYFLCKQNDIMRGGTIVREYSFVPDATCPKEVLSLLEPLHDGWVSGKANLEEKFKKGDRAYKVFQAFLAWDPEKRPEKSLGEDAQA